MSRGFVAAIIGVLITIGAWFAPWKLPGLPAIVALHLLSSADTSYGDLAASVRVALVTGLIALNVTSWALVVYACLWLTSGMRSRRAAA